MSAGEWICNACGYGIFDSEAEWRQATHRDAHGKPAENNGTLWCPFCPDETMIPLTAEIAEAAGAPMSDSGFTLEQREPSTWTREEWHNRLRMLIAAVTHPNSTQRHVVVTVAEARSLAELISAGSASQTPAPSWNDKQPTYPDKFATHRDVAAPEPAPPSDMEKVGTITYHQDGRIETQIDSVARTPEPPPWTREQDKALHQRLVERLQEAVEWDRMNGCVRSLETHVNDLMPIIKADTRPATAPEPPETKRYPACNYCGSVYPAEHQKNCALLKFRPAAKERG